MPENAAQSEDWYSNDFATLGDRIAAGREALGLTPEDLAGRIGVKLTTLEGWEADTREPRANKLQMLAGLLNVSMKWLLTGDGEGLDAVTVASDERDIELLLADMRVLRTRIAQDAEKLAVLERALRERLRALAEIRDV